MDMDCQSVASAAEMTTLFKQLLLATRRLPSQPMVSRLEKSSFFRLLTKHFTGIRIKASAGDTGTIKGVTYTGITLSGITGYATVQNPLI